MPLYNRLESVYRSLQEFTGVYRSLQEFIYHLSYIYVDPILTLKLPLITIIFFKLDLHGLISNKTKPCFVVNFKMTIEMPAFFMAG